MPSIPTKLVSMKPAGAADSSLHGVAVTADVLMFLLSGCLHNVAVTAKVPMFFGLAV